MGVQYTDLEETGGRCSILTLRRQVGVQYTDLEEAGGCAVY